MALLSESQIKDFERVWEDIYLDIEELIIAECKTLPDRNYRVSEATVRLFFDICTKSGMIVSLKKLQKFCNNEINEGTMLIGECKYERYDIF